MSSASASGTLTRELDAPIAAAWARCALAGLARHYPYALQHLMQHADDRPRPDELHPIFHGSYDWHSSVHMQWSLARLLRLQAVPAERAEIEALFDHRFTTAAAARELAHLQARPGFERPYGWAWLLFLQRELRALGEREAKAVAWADTLAPLAALLRERWLAHLALVPYPQRGGAHGNSAFAMTLALRCADDAHDPPFAAALRDAALRWFGADVRYPASYEPSAGDFLSPGLCEAVLMQRADPDAFADWWRAFRPDDAAFATWLAPVAVASRTDAQLVHADGLNLSRAWCLRSIAEALPAGSVDRKVLATAREAHLQASLPHVVDGDFVATHWLVSFALLALT